MLDYSSICIHDVSLRDYQQQAKKKIFSEWNRVDRVMYQMPTGTGKTRLFTSIIRDIGVWGLTNNDKQKILIIAHRTELIDQIHNSLIKYHIPHGIISGAHKKDRNLIEAVQVASIQTITSAANRDIAVQLEVDFLIIDEAHHAIANTYVRLCQLYPNAKVLGVTATPWRLSGEGFGRIFDSFIPSMPISEFMRQGWLAPYDYYSIDSGSSVSSIVDGIKDCDISGDYKVKAMEQALDVDHIRAKLLQSYMKYVSGKKGIIYSISRTHSEHICRKYQSIGVRIVSIDSETPARQREQYVSDFKNGKIDVIVNVDIFSEGFDCPNIEFVQLARPTKSLVKYIQQVGRGLRVNGGKRCVILDNVGMYTRFGLPDVDHPWQEYFEGTLVQERSSGCKSIKVGVTEVGGCDKNLEEGEDDMVLIQALTEAAVLTENRNLEQNTIVKNLPQHIPDKEDYKIIASSTPFFSSKFQIEETSDGYYLLNLKAGTRKFLLNYPTYRSGTIKLLRESHNVYKVLRCSILVTGMKEKQTIIGQIRKDGGLVKFKPLVGEELDEISFY